MSVVNHGQPVGSSTTGAIATTGTSGTTGTFSPNSGSTYYVCVGLANGAQTAIPSSTVAWATGGSGTWSKIAHYSPDQFSPAVEVWKCTTTSAPGSSSISVTGNSTTGAVFASVLEFTGDNATQPGASFTGNISAAQQAITPNSTGSLCLQVAVDTFEGFTPTANGSSTNTGGFNDSGQELWSTVTSSTTTASTPVTVGDTNTTSANAVYMLVVEITPAATVSVPPDTKRRSQRGIFKPRRTRTAIINPNTPIITIQALPPQGVRPRRYPWPGRHTRRGDPPGPLTSGKTIQALPPQGVRPRRYPDWRHGVPRQASPPLPLTSGVTVQLLPPQSPRPRYYPDWRRRTHQGEPPAPLTSGVTIQVLPPQGVRPRRYVDWQRRARQASPPVPNTAVVTIQALPPQGVRPRRYPWPGPRTRKGEPPAPQASGVTIQVLPPQGVRPRRYTNWRRVARQASPPVASTAVVTIQALPPQGVRPRRYIAFTRRAKTVSTFPITIQALPPQGVRPRRYPWPGPRTRKGEPPAPLSSGITIQVLGPQRPRPRWYLLWRRRARVAEPGWVGAPPILVPLATMTADDFAVIRMAADDSAEWHIQVEDSELFKIITGQTGG